jgi:WD40 repeat protein
VSGDS